ncbi:hypothetical protein EVAR_68799_1 [Eumeta japonica]|uniref:Uncharacterized protein n=1 Tax=Eumeta variegata TaxID=151549 RepID=A0A4C1ZY29_EUMVA|nr:hypothetical protein EVAR_68799_1 [Eumeta japonica]
MSTIDGFLVFGNGFALVTTAAHGPPYHAPTSRCESGWEATWLCSSLKLGSSAERGTDPSQRIDSVEFRTEFRSRLAQIRRLLGYDTREHEIRRPYARIRLKRISMKITGITILCAI